MALNRDRIFKAADGYIRAGKVEKAIAELEKWVAANRKDWNTIRQIGDLYARINRNAEAIKKYSQIADYYRQDGFNVRAIATYKMILRLDPQNETAMRNLAELQEIQGLLMEAKAQYQALVELYSRQGHKRQAAEVFKKLTEIDPSDLKVRYKFAEFLEREGKVDEAVAEYVGIADQFISQGLVAEAIQFMEKGLRIDSSSRLLRTKLAQAEILQGQHDKAIQLLEEVREQHPRDVELLTGLGEAYMGAGKSDSAESVFGRLAELEPDNPQHSSRLAELAVGQGQYDQALEIIGPTVDRLVSNRDGEKAAGCLQKILSRDPHHIQTLLKLVEVHTILKQEGGRISGYDQLCEAYAKQGDYQRAVQVAEQLIEIEPENSQHKDRMRFLKSKLGTPAPAEAEGEGPAPPVELEPEPAPPEPPGPAIDLDAAVSSTLEPELMPVEPAPALQDDKVAEEIEAVASLTPEEDEHIKEKTTEAEVFVRYGLVDKAVEQLKEVLERFRFHTASREKLIEIYKDEGMSNEAADQLVQLSTIYARLGQNDKAEEALQEARGINPALADAPVDSLLPGEDAGDLTLEAADQFEGLGFNAPEPEASLSGEIAVSVPEAPDRVDEPAVNAEDDIPVAMEDQAIAEPALDTGERVGAAGEQEEFSIEVDVDDEEGAGVEAVDTPEAPDVPEVLEEMPIEVDMGTESDGVSFEGAVEEAPEVEIDLGGIDAGLAGDQEEEDVQVEFDESEAAAPDLAVSPEDRTQPPGTPAQALEAPESPPAEAVAAPARDELGEVDEFMALGLYEDARHTLRELLKKRPGDEQVLAKIDEVGFSVAQLQKEAEGPAEVPEEVAPLESALETGAPEPEQPALQAAEEEPLASLDGIGAPDDIASLVDGPHGIGDDFVDLASELSDEVFGTQNAVDESTSTPEPPEAITDPGLDEMFREFKKGVEKQLGAEDYDTRYNLGIAYKEMGLLDEAIAEFQLASKDQNRLLECCSMLGLCFMEKGMATIAIKWFEKGLSAPGRSEEEQLGLRYDLAQAHEAAGESERALELFMDIEGENNKFRDVREKVRGLQAAQK